MKMVQDNSYFVSLCSLRMKTKMACGFVLSCIYNSFKAFLCKTVMAGSLLRKHFCKYVLSTFLFVNNIHGCKKSTDLFLKNDKMLMKFQVKGSLSFFLGGGEFFWGVFWKIQGGSLSLCFIAFLFYHYPYPLCASVCWY
jgi:hypothetical protein